MPKEIIYRVLYHQQEVPFELYARSVSESEMFGFVELEELVFDASNSNVEIQEKIKQEFEAVKRTYIPLANVFRIDTIERDEDLTGKRSSTGNVTVFPKVNQAKTSASAKPKKDV